MIADVARARQSAGRLQGLRLLRPPARPGGLSQEDLMDMVFLRLDSVAVLTMGEDGLPKRLHYAQILPGPREGALRRLDAAALGQGGHRLRRPGQALEDEMARTDRAVEPAAQAVQARPDAERRASWWGRAAVQARAGTVPGRAEGVGEDGRVVRRRNHDAAGGPGESQTAAGKGKLGELEIQALGQNAGIIVFDRELTPAQMRNLADATERKILDEVRPAHPGHLRPARRQPGRQAPGGTGQLRYMQPRLVGQNRALSRLAGGIGGRGPARPSWKWTSAGCAGASPG